jgi:hypothetical protein
MISSETFRLQYVSIKLKSETQMYLDVNEVCIQNRHTGKTTAIAHCVSILK